jgi:pimeloyl-ACP methyl ester carboxylesterase
VSSVRTTQTLRHVRVQLALHCLRDTPGPKLLLLHGLAEATPETVPTSVADWPGSIWGLDFTGHGESQRPRGGGYTCELLMGDVDCALRVLGPSTILGRGLGGYIGLLIAGARPQVVRGLIIADGVGIAGGGTEPTTPVIDRPLTAPTDANVSGPDPFALIELASDLRPPDYAITFVNATLEDSVFDSPISIVTRSRAPWLVAVAGCFGVRTTTVSEALQDYARS